MSGRHLLLMLLGCTVGALGQATTTGQTCVEFGGCPSEATCSSKAVSSLPTQRVRREVRSLDTAEWQKVVHAIWTLKNTSLSEGVAKYGKAFKSYDYFVLKHAVATKDVRGDQAHFSDAFMTWHAAFVLEFELALLSVDPTIEGLPYWDSTKGTPSMFTSTLMGSAPGTGPNQEVVDGAFANFPVEANFSWAPYAEYVTEAHPQNGYHPTGFLRSADYTTATSVVARYGSPFEEPNGFPKETFELCATGGGAGTWSWGEWYKCIENYGSRGLSMHSGPHVTIGGFGSGGRKNGGDFEDTVTSPNDPMFFFHHPNLDRNRLWYQLTHAHMSASAWGFSAAGGSHANTNTAFDGINLNDVMASTFPFTKGQLGLAAESSADYTAKVSHADVLCLLSPWSAPYRYDDFDGCAFVGDSPSSGCTYLSTGTTNSPRATVTVPTAETPSPPNSASLATPAMLLLAGVMLW